jgi:hypothetical protein
MLQVPKITILRAFQDSFFVEAKLAVMLMITLLFIQRIKGNIVV